MTFPLVIDDNRETADALVQILKIWNLKARPAFSPATAMALLQSETPMMIFLDINMPGVDGFEVLGFLKREPRLCGIPVIIVTSDDQPETKQRAIKGGALDLIVKPVMVDTVENALLKAGLI